ncbi:hypothetical protein ACXZAQ_02450 [Citrobacter portucalensis]|uniref:hypothetical protein n=1 Tax=Citrobacter portucalensis TaxID=1639133 RepID=UPI001C63D8B5|nr:hypothetical protein [Citrobacter portucalensis]MBW7618115.1 hypothetical protein [Citrobacter portucalensis]MBW7637129.1 hypothetical protein [Citrobacter portucalensis]MCA2131214.1 hypothetical protein [Citrobacter portucalensis]MCA2141393.1 hypothetical protein [Citrobacter portucalensis]MCA2147184.1 hypothetical protein [Citrobacter portucalensis]
MHIACNLIKENNVITFQDFRTKHSEVISAQGELRQGLINVGIKLRGALEDSLSLPQRQWKNPTTDEMVDYVYILAEKKGKTEVIHPYEMNFDEGMGVSFLLAVTIDKTPTSFPKTTMAVPVRVVRNGEVYVINLRKGDYETSIPLEFNDSDLSEVCEVIKQFILKDLDGYIPSK